MGLVKSEGTVIVENKDISKLSIKDRRNLISYVPQDRKCSGSSQNDSILKNSIMTHHYVNTKIFNSLGLLKGKECRKLTRDIINNYQVSSQGENMIIGSLSGGNQQKVILGRELELSTNLLIVDQPVRGLDVGSIEYIHKKIIEKRDFGVGILLISADLDELFSLSDKIIVMYKGKIAMEKDIKDTTREEVGSYMLGARGELA